ncbi:RibD family protein [Allohahella sp. A8]|uniref:RibD family protein n=1 Tax=Allohahella sp. A8 TaxID=3141461 RepID=UPI003A80DF32
MADDVSISLPVDPRCRDAIMELSPTPTLRAHWQGSINASTAWKMILDIRRGREIEALTLAEDGGWQSYAKVTAEARQLFDIYLPLVSRAGDAPLVIAQMGQTLDGRIATVDGRNELINGPAGLIHLHRLRALMDAVVIGAGTAIADDPLLTVRHVEGPSPVRVVIDPNGRVPGVQRLFRDGCARTLQLCIDAASSCSGNAVPDLADTASGCGVRGVLATLQALGLKRVLIEGGGTTVSRFLEAGVLDRIHVTVAPMILGSGKSSFMLSEISSIDAAVRARTRRFSLDQDTLFDLEFSRH